MASVEAELSTELTRIINCPYPASLSKLADILSRADSLTIRQCVRDRPPCVVTRLASIVSEALPLWAYALRILQSLCHSPEFRDRLLLQNPSLLDDLLKQANPSQRELDELCVLLLSRPLPDAVVLPASAQSFFLRLFQRATQDPTAATLKPVYYMLNGACKGIFDLLSPDVRQGFDEELSHILSSHVAGKSTMLLLWCFGIVMLAEHHQDVGKKYSPGSSSDDSTLVGTCRRQWKTASGRKLFGSTLQMRKTVGLVYLSVYWVIRGTENFSNIEATEAIRIANRTMQFVDQTVREDYPKHSPEAFLKLPDKVLRQGIEPTLQLETLRFYAMIAGENQLLPQMTTEYETTVMKLVSLADIDSVGECLAMSMPIFAPCMSTTSIRTLLLELLRVSITTTSAHELSIFRILADELRSIIPSCGTFRSQFLLALSSNEVQNSLQSFLRANPTGSSTAKVQQCHIFMVALRWELVSAMLSMLLTAILTAQPMEKSLPNSLALALLDKQQQLPNIPNQCIHHTTKRLPSLSLFQQGCTPPTGQQDWRDRIKSELERQSLYQQDSIIRSIAQVCEDLETRCNTVEEPLRREREKSKQLEQKVAELHSELSSLRTQAFDARNYIEGLEETNADVEEEKVRIAAKLDKLEVEFANANQIATEALRKAQEDFSARELQLQSTVAAHEDDLRVRREDVKNLNESIASLTSEFQKQEGENKILDERYNDVQAELRDMVRQLDGERQLVSEQAEEISRLKDSDTYLQSQLEKFKTELKTVSGQFSELEACHKGLIQSSKDALQELEAKYNYDMDSAASKATKEHDQLKTELKDALESHKQIEDAYQEARQDLQHIGASVTMLEAEVQELRSVCSKKEKELHRIEAWKRNVSAALSCLPASPKAQAPESTSHSRDDPNDAQAFRQHRRRKSSIQTRNIISRAPTSTQSITATAMENVANASFTSSDSWSSTNDPTPKRAKPRPVFKVPTIHTSYGQKPALAPRSLSKNPPPAKNRSALQPTSPNRRHTIGGFAVPEEGEGCATKDVVLTPKRRDSLRDVKRINFDGDDLIDVDGTHFTPGNFLSGTGRIPEEEETHSEM